MVYSQRIWLIPDMSNITEEKVQSIKNNCNIDGLKRIRSFEIPKPDEVDSKQVNNLNSLKRFKSYSASGSISGSVTSASISNQDKEISNAESKAKTEISANAKSFSAGSASLLVSSRQRGNPLLQCIRSVPWEYCDDLIPDYQMSRTSCALFLSVRYHTLNPDYIHQRIAQLRKQYDLRVLLVQVDVTDPQYALRELGRLCLLCDLTLIVCSSAEEAGRYLEAYKILEHKTADLLMNDRGEESGANQFLSNACDFLTGIKSVNNSDANMLLRTFGSLKDVIQANENELRICPGIGSLKISRITRAFNMPFLKRPPAATDCHVKSSVNS